MIYLPFLIKFESMKIKGKYKGSKVWIKSIGHQIEVCDENAAKLKNNGHGYMVQGAPELKPLKKVVEIAEEPSEYVSLNEKQDSSILLSKLSTEALNDFEGRKPADVKKDFALLEIKHPKTAGLKKLADIIKNLD